MSTIPPISAPAACWSCHSALASSALICPACNKIQPPAQLNYFQVFGVERKLNFDTAVLEQEFHRLSRRLHPDRFARATPQEQQWSLASTALLNDAYRTLREPISRVEYLLVLEGLKLGEENSGKSKKPDRQPPPTCLKKSLSSTCSSKRCA